MTISKIKCNNINDLRILLLNVGYNSLNTKTEYRKSVMPDNTREVYEAILGILRYRQTQIELPIRKLTNEEIIRCLQKILGSVNFHMKGWDGSTNYLDFIEEFVR